MKISAGSLILPLLTLALVLKPALAGAKSLYVGSGSCGAAGCHGGVTPQTNQFTTWSTDDKHSKAYGVLFNKRSKTMATVLGLGVSAHESGYCLSCHAENAPIEERGKKFDLQDGVACESCHGAAGKWLEPHTRSGWSYAQSLKLGMRDNRNMTVRAGTCLNCHSGIDHRLLSAGHPDLVFELDTFAAVMPKHWKEKSKWANARAWAVGQAVALKKSMETLKDRSERHKKLNEADMNCFSCHHNIYDVSWSLQEDATGRPVWNSSRHAVFRHFLESVFPEEAKAVQEQIDVIQKNFRAEAPEIWSVAHAAGEVARIVSGLLPQIESYAFSPVFTQKVLESIAGDRDAYQKGGFRVAEQGLMAADALSLALVNAGSPIPGVRQQVKKLYDILDVKDPARYDPTVFSQEIEKLKRH